MDSGVLYISIYQKDGIFLPISCDCLLFVFGVTLQPKTKQL